MLDKTLDLIKEYVILKTYQAQVDAKDEIVNDALEILKRKIQSDITSDKARQKEIEKNKERIEKKKRLKNAI